jgi:hypothetical protein
LPIRYSYRLFIQYCLYIFIDHTTGIRAIRQL